MIYPPSLCQRLRHAFDELVHYLAVGLARNQKLVQMDQYDYHHDLKTRFAQMKDTLRQYYSEPMAEGDGSVEAELERLRQPQDEADIAFLEGEGKLVL